MLDCEDLPRRCYIDRHTPAERAIKAAVHAVEASGAHPLLSDAVSALMVAFNKVADHTDLSSDAE